MKIVAVSGFARSGKDTIANTLQEVIQDNLPNLKVSRESFASFLKDEMNSFILEKFNKDVYSLDGEEKEMIRPLLVAYGFARRKQTEGRYFVDLLQRKMQIENNDVCIISDLRYAEKENDELYWLKNETKGKLIHITRYDMVNGKKKFFQAPNSDEKNNDPILKGNADYKISWETAKTDQELKENSLRLCEEFFYQNINFFQ
jgi:hypothetical protein